MSIVVAVRLITGETVDVLVSELAPPMVILFGGPALVKRVVPLAPVIAFRLRKSMDPV